MFYTYAARAPGGMPVGCNGSATLLLSGGIDSPVAGCMIAKRGVSLTAVHFESFPYTSDKALDKVYDLTKLMSPLYWQYKAACSALYRYTDEAAHRVSLQSI